MFLVFGSDTMYEPNGDICDGFLAYVRIVSIEPQLQPDPFNRELCYAVLKVKPDNLFSRLEEVYVPLKSCFSKDFDKTAQLLSTLNVGDKIFVRKKNFEGIPENVMTITTGNIEKIL